MLGEKEFVVATLLKAVVLISPSNRLWEEDKDLNSMELIKKMYWEAFAFTRT